MVIFFSNFMKMINIDLWVSKIRNMKKTTARHIVIKLLKNSDEKILKAARGKRYITEKHIQ